MRCCTRLLKHVVVCHSTPPLQGVLHLPTRLMAALARTLLLSFVGASVIRRGRGLRFAERCHGTAAGLVPNRCVESSTSRRAETFNLAGPARSNHCRSSCLPVACSLLVARPLLQYNPPRLGLASRRFLADRISGAIQARTRAETRALVFLLKSVWHVSAPRGSDIAVVCAISVFLLIAVVASSVAMLCRWNLNPDRIACASLSPNSCLLP